MVNFLKQSNSKFLLILGIFGVTIFFFAISINFASAACDKDATVSVSARNEIGEYIPNISFALLKQVEDVYGLPKPGTQVATGKIDPITGLGTVKFRAEGKFVLKMWHKNSTAGAFYFYNEINLSCGQTLSVTENLSAINFILRDPDGQLKKNTKFKIYTQRQDVDGNPIKEKQDLVAELDTTAEGTVIIYVAEKIRSMDGKGSEYYVLESAVTGGSFLYWDIKVAVNKTTIVNYIFSDLIIQLQDASGKRVSLKDVDLYKTKVNLNGEYALDTKLVTRKTDNDGLVRFEFPAGLYAIAVKDSLDKANPFWEIKVVDQKRQTYSLTTNYIRINTDGFNLSTASLNIYSMNRDVDGLFYRVTKVKSVPFKTNQKFLDFSLKSEPYLFTIITGQNEYGKAIYTVNNKFQELLIKNETASLITPLQRYQLEVPSPAKPTTTAPTAPSQTLTTRLSGYILLQVESHGEAWYVDAKTKSRYYMKDGATAYEMLRKFGLGITNADLAKIPVGLDDRFKGSDVDGDSLSDKLEDALGTNRNLADTDGDGFDDGVEIRGNYDPLAGGGKKLPIDSVFAAKQKGKILLQVQAHGEAWYVNPKDTKRYYLPDGAGAYEIMRFLSLGITNADLAKIPIGNL